MISLDGKRVLITGASRGIGLAAAKQMADLGAQVALVSRSQESVDQAAAEVGRGAIGIAAHVADEDAARAAIGQVIDRFGGLDVLVNNAGTNPAYGPVVAQERSRFDKTFEVNVWGSLLWTRLAYELALKENGGAVVNTASIGGLVQEPYIGLYNAAKASLIHLTETLALELGPTVRVNAVAPGIVRTKLAEALWREHEQQVAAASALGRIGEPEDVAGAITFLASDAASWITGSCLVVDGGQSLGNAAMFRKA